MSMLMENKIQLEVDHKFKNAKLHVEKLGKKVIIEKRRMDERVW
jgi:hypothetical protein